MRLHLKTAPRLTPVRLAHSRMESPWRSRSLTAFQSSMVYLPIASHPQDMCNDH